MPPRPPRREDRQSGDRRSDQRGPFQRDRDRILYASAFRRLAGVTQVVSPAADGVFHNRLTHTLKVAQGARRLAEMFLRRRGGPKAARDWGEIDADVVEAAALAHDLGHPPFGHVAEEELNGLVSRVAGVDGYEGNAQSFRITTRLAVRHAHSPHGLDLTRATLNATLKYPRLPAEGVRKYGAYHSEEADFRFARAADLDSPHPCIEAQIMDWADDIAYSVHDTEDFYRAGLIPLDRLAVRPAERTRFLDRACRRRESLGRPFQESPQDLGDIFDRLCEALQTREPYAGTRSQRANLYAFTSKSIADYVENTRLLRPPGRNGSGLDVPADYRTQVALLKELTWCYVIDNPALATHQYGQRKVIRTLFEILSEAAERRDWGLFPPQHREEAEDVLRQEGSITPARSARLVADTIASLTDQQALRLYQRLIGLSPETILAPILS